MVPRGPAFAVSCPHETPEVIPARELTVRSPQMPSVRSHFPVELGSVRDPEAQVGRLHRLAVAGGPGWGLARLLRRGEGSRLGRVGGQAKRQRAQRSDVVRRPVCASLCRLCWGFRDDLRVIGSEVYHENLRE